MLVFNYFYFRNCAANVVEICNTCANQMISIGGLSQISVTIHEELNTASTQII